LLGRNVGVVNGRGGKTLRSPTIYGEKAPGGTVEGRENQHLALPIEEEFLRQSTPGVARRMPKEKLRL